MTKWKPLPNQNELEWMANLINHGDMTRSGVGNSSSKGLLDRMASDGKWVEMIPGRCPDEDLFRPTQRARALMQIIYDDHPNGEQKQ
jgi:hypothetical protein